MDIDLLSKMVKELILDNDKVVLPGLGAFVAEIVPSTFSDKGYTINPPYRRLYFRSKPNEGDALVDFYMAANNLSREVAEKVIREFVEELRSVLHVRKTVIFPGLGRLRATKENTIFFVADEDLDIYPDGFGLESISLKAHQETSEEVSAAVAELKSIVDTVTEEPVIVEEPAVIEERAVIEEPVAVVIEEPVVIEESVAVEVEEPSSVVETLSVEEPAPAEDPVEEPAAEDTVAQETVGQEVVVEEVLPVVEETPVKDKQTWKTLLKLLLVVVVTVLVLLAVFTVVARMSPHLFDSILYSPEELEILNR